MRVCDVFIEKRFMQNQTLTYRVEDFSVCEGVRVRIRVNGREMIGYVSAVYNAQADDFNFDLQAIEGVLDEKPILNEELTDLSKFLAYQTVSPLITCIQTMLPNMLKPKSSARQGKKIKVLERVKGVENVSLTLKQQELLDAFESRTYMRIKEASSIYSNYSTLIEKGLLVRNEVEARHVEIPVERVEPEYDLSADQTRIVTQVDLSKNNTYVLHGVTGSGKTEVYLTLAKRVVDQGKQVLILVPEIALTPQMIERVSKRFGKDIAIYHSALNEQQKYEQYQRVQEGEIQVVVGTRSASFLPFSKLGLIVLDEEHDESYKQDSTPYYHARDVALWRAKRHDCPLILGSASPALDTYARALKNVYTLLELPSRINESLPAVELIDTKDALHNRENAILTKRLQTLIQETLDRKEQVMLLLNRRGYLTWIKDIGSDAVLMCPNCDVALNYHHYDKCLKCHVCGYMTRQFAKNQSGDPKQLIGGGAGTQRLEHWLNQVFPEARIIRMDRDTTTQKNSHARILDTFNAGKADILIGTQMIAKGLDNPNVTLVGITNIDAALARTDYRSVEHTFDLVLQAAGRSGRGAKQGKVAIQTFNPNHYAIVFGANHDYKRFFKQEMQYRKQAGYPPYRYLIAVYFKDQTVENVERASRVFIQCLGAFDGKIIGPTESKKMNLMHEIRVILKGVNLERMLECVHSTLDGYYKIERVGVNVDVNPLTLM